jgi:hypothetical protein
MLLFHLTVTVVYLLLQLGIVSDFLLTAEIDALYFYAIFPLFQEQFTQNISDEIDLYRLG